MHWKLKWLFSLLLSLVPFSIPIYNVIQRSITKRWRRNVEQTLGPQSIYLQHVNTYKSIRQITNYTKYFEYGVARDLFSNLVNYSFGIKHQLAIDLQPLASIGLVNDVIRQLAELSDSVLPLTIKPTPMRDFSDLRNIYGIDYRAPADARSLSVPDESIDWIATTSTLEHIPVNDIRAIHRECYRILKNGGLMTHQIDYSDHYSHGNKNVSRYMFLTFSDDEWNWWHMRHYYTNRLRHSDHRALLVDAGFKILEERIYRPQDAHEKIKGVELDKKYLSYSLDDLTITNGFFVCVKS
jgi:SAM-dependent methyltransferase